MKNLRIVYSNTLFIIIFFTVSSEACYRARSLENMAKRITQRQAHAPEKQRALITAYKQSLVNNAPFKSHTVQQIFSAVIHKNQTFTRADKQTITKAIEKFHAVQGFDKVFWRLLNGIISKNNRNFNGAFGELSVALEKENDTTKIIAFNEEVKDSNGKILTDFDLVMQDESGTKHAIEVKSRKKSPSSRNIDKTQLEKQRNLARSRGWKHELQITIRD